jgi:predicted oxidoreductase
MTELRNEGKVKYWGVSNHSYTQVELLQSRLDFPLVTNQIEFSPTCLTGMDDGTLDQCQRLRMSPMCWSPLGGGSLFKKDVSNDPKTERLQKALKKVAGDYGSDTTLDQVAYAFLLRHPSKPVIVLGTNKTDRLKAAAAVYDKKMNLDRQQFYLIWEASKGHSVP